LSSILKALRKIEEESPDLDELPFLGRSTGAHRSGNAPNGRLRLWVKIGFAVCIMAMLAAGGVLFLDHRQLISSKSATETRSPSREDAPQSEIPPAPSDIFRSKITVSSTPSVQGSLQVPQPAKKQSSDALPKENIQHPKTDRVELQPTAESVPAAPAARMLPSAKTTDRKISPTKIPKTETSMAGNDKTRDRTPANPPIPATDVHDRIDDSNIKLQALAWFEDASKRMAVINDRIVREGESVDGYQVTEIRQEDVVVSDGSKSWLLKFALKE
jgi:hypothetical protein